METPHPKTPQPESGFFVLTIAAMLFRRWRVFVSFPVVLVLIALVLSLVVHKHFTAVASFTPQTTDQTDLTGALANVAGQFGLPIGILGGGDESPDFYRSLLTSREILTSTLNSEFDDPRAIKPTRAPLLDILDIKEDTPEERLGEGIRQLLKRIDASVDKRTNIVTLEVTLRWPSLAASVANRMIDLLNEFNLDRLRLHSRQQREFVSARVEEADSELARTEAILLSFLQTNRSYRNSPLLVFEQARLQRKVDLRQEVALTLRRELEQARIAEVRDTPVLTIIDQAVPPDKKSSPKILLNLILASIVGTVVAFFVAQWQEIRDKAAKEGWDVYSDFRNALSSARRDAGALLRVRRTG